MRARKPIVVALMTVSLISTSLVGQASAAITVSNTNDSGPGSLRQAVEEAPAGESIVMPAGTYDLKSPLEIEKPVTITGHGSADTNLRAVANTRVFEVVSGGSLSLTDLAFRDMTFSNPSGVIQGGLIYNNKAPLSLLRVAVDGVSIDASGASGKGGGVIQGGLILTSGPLAMVDSSVDGNRITANGGAGSNGGVIQGGLVQSDGQTTIRNVALDGNTIQTKGGQVVSSSGQNGGVIQGGAVELVLSSASGPSIVEDVSVSSNSGDASGGPGANGGVIQSLALSATVTEGNLTFRNATIAGNTATTAGTPEGVIQPAGLSLTAFSGATASLISSTIDANRAESSRPEAGVGNIYAAGQISIADTIIAAGGGASGKENCQLEGGATSAGFNIDSLDQCGFHLPGDKWNTDPQLGPLQGNGGPGLSMVPAATSPAVDQGSAPGQTTDQRGILRPIDFPSIANPDIAGADGSDIGAVELQPSNAVGLGKLKKNRQKGTATLVVTLPQPVAGTLALTGKGLKGRTITLTTQSTVRFVLRPIGKAKKGLRRKGSRKVAASVTYTPIGNTAVTVTRKAKLVMKKPGRKHKKPKN